MHFLGVRMPCLLSCTLGMTSDGMRSTTKRCGGNRSSSAMSPRASVTPSYGWFNTDGTSSTVSKRLPQNHLPSSCLRLNNIFSFSDHTTLIDWACVGHGHLGCDPGTSSPMHVATFSSHPHCFPRSMQRSQRHISGVFGTWAGRVTSGPFVWGSASWRPNGPGSRHTSCAEQPWTATLSTVVDRLIPAICTVSAQRCSTTWLRWPTKHCGSLLSWTSSPLGEGSTSPSPDDADPLPATVKRSYRVIEIEMLVSRWQSTDGKVAHRAR